MKTLLAVLAAAGVFTLNALPSQTDVASTSPAVVASAQAKSVKQVSLRVQARGQRVTATTVLAAKDRRVRVQSWGLCVRQNNTFTRFGTYAPTRTIKRGGNRLTRTVQLKPGRYVIRACYRVEGKSRAYVGRARTITVVKPTQNLFLDTFDGSGAYDHRKWGEWSTCTYNPTAAYGQIKCGDRARLDGRGHLVIPATPTMGTSISTKDTFRFTYGTLEARVRVPVQAGYWPAFWTLNGTSRGEQINGVAGEVDVLEAYTQFNDGYRSAIHHYSGSEGYGPEYNNPLCANEDVRGEWHTYGARIEPNRVTFTFDGKTCWSTTKAQLNGKRYGLGPDQQAGNWMLLTNAVGNESQGMRPPTENSETLVDWVRVRRL